MLNKLVMLSPNRDRYQYPSCRPILVPHLSGMREPWRLTTFRFEESFVKGVAPRRSQISMETSSNSAAGYLCGSMSREDARSRRS